MTNKNITKKTFICILIVLSFIVGRLWESYPMSLQRWLCTVYSDSQVRSHILGLYYIPENSYRLYYGQCGFPEAETFVAFSAPREACLDFINSNGGKFSEMKTTTEIDERIKNFFPGQKYPDLDHSNWDLSPGKVYLKCNTTIGILLFDENINRIYLYKPA